MPEPVEKLSLSPSRSDPLALTLGPVVPILRGIPFLLNAQLSIIVEAPCQHLLNVMRVDAYQRMAPPPLSPTDPM